MIELDFKINYNTNCYSIYNPIIGFNLSLRKKLLRVEHKNGKA